MVTVLDTRFENSKRVVKSKKPIAALAGAPEILLKADPAWAGKFDNLKVTFKNEKRASVKIKVLKTVWFNTGTLCNVDCLNCYIDSGKTNNRFVYMTVDQVTELLAEIKMLNKNLLKKCQVDTIGLTGGEPLLNPYIEKIIQLTLEAGFKIILLTNAMLLTNNAGKSSKKWHALVKLQQLYPDQITVRVSIDHYTKELHEEERGKNSWEPGIRGFKKLSEHGFSITVAGRTRWKDDISDLRSGYTNLFKQHGISLDANKSEDLVLFPELDPHLDLPEITTGCWEKLNRKPEQLMCSSEKMVASVLMPDNTIKLQVMPCTLLPYDGRLFQPSLTEAVKSLVPFANPMCASCFLSDGVSCSG